MGRLEGQADILDAPDGLVLRESGRLQFGTHQADAAQRYHFRFLHPSLAQVMRADGSHFHDLDLSSGMAIIVHQCGNDLYRGRYRVLDGDRYVVGWRVIGPRKRYRMASLYARTA